MGHTVENIANSVEFGDLNAHVHFPSKHGWYVALPHAPSEITLPVRNTQYMPLMHSLNYSWGLNHRD